MRLFTTLWVIFLLACTQSNQRDIDALRDRIEQEISTVDGTISVALISLEVPGDTLFIDADRMYHAASTMKTPVMIEAYRQAFDGGITIMDSVLVHNEFKSIVDGSVYSIQRDRDGGSDFHDLIGSYVPMRDVIYNMTILSGNLATNLVIDIVGAEHVVRTMRELGAHQIEVLRGVEDMLAFQQGLNNRTSARDLAVIFEHLARGTAVSPEMDADMISILKDQEFRRMIPAGLPENARVAHKTGTITAINHDSGIVYLPDGRSYVLVILTGGIQDTQESTRIGAAISRHVYEWYTGM
ncbi:MAG: serine hydrolase [Bacteroidetes bacterium]|nr:serine hydrolase [Bacteroidota bacterium]